MAPTPKELQARNFAILKDKISGLTYAALEAKYGLCRQSLCTIITRQKAKVAEWDSEYQRRLGSLKQHSEDSEEQAKALARQLDANRVELEMFKKQARQDKETIRTLESTIGSLRESMSDQQKRIRQLEEALASHKTTMFYAQHEAIKDNMNRYR
jgi:chromosome segregation ATPase|tara:strand:+ start:235 stop:699 length:465 start_codon:yes stop_codon:yes gene_type:complete